MIHFYEEFKPKVSTASNIRHTSSKFRAVAQAVCMPAEVIHFCDTLVDILHIKFHAPSSGVSIILIRPKAELPWFVTTTFLFTLLVPHFCNVNHRSKLQCPTSGGANVAPNSLLTVAILTSVQANNYEAERWGVMFKSHFIEVQSICSTFIRKKLTHGHYTMHYTPLQQSAAQYEP